MRGAHENIATYGVDLNDLEIHVLNSSVALSPYDPDYYAVRLGFRSGHALKAEADRLTDALRARQPMSFDDWCSAIDIIGGLMSPRDSEWQTVTGIDYLNTAKALVAIARKVDLAFGGPAQTLAIGPEQARLPD